MEVPTKWSRTSVINFIKGLGKHAGVCAPMGMFASFDLSGFTQTGHCQGTRYVQELVFASHLSSEVRSRGRSVEVRWADRLVNMRMNNSG